MRPKSMTESSEEDGDNKGGVDKFSTASGLACDGKTSVNFFQGQPWSSCTFVDMLVLFTPSAVSRTYQVKI